MTKNLFFTAKELRSIPGHSTSLDVAKLQGMVAGLLTEAGLDYALMQKDGQDLIMIEMILDTSQCDVKRMVHFKLEVPKVYQKMKRGDPKPLPAVGWRFFYDYLERRIQAVRLGITDLVEEFTANIVMQLPDGTQGTLGDAIKQSAEDIEAPLLPFVMEAVNR